MIFGGIPQRKVFLIYVDLDTTNSMFCTARAAQESIQNIVNRGFSNYGPVVGFVSVVNSPESGKQRVCLILYIDLDPVPGKFHTQESMQNVLRTTMTYEIPHYNPLVSLAPSSSQPYVNEGHATA